MARRIEVDHLARVEGHGGISVELVGGRVKSVQLRLFEGARLIEGLLRGRHFSEISQIASRICAICSASHSLTAIDAIEDAFDIQPSRQTLLLRELLLRGENIESHALHLFLLAMPDYFGYPSGPAMAAEHGEAVDIGLRLKKLGNAIQEAVGGRAVHPVNAIIGGFGTPPSIDQLIDLRDRLQQGLEDCRTVIELLAALPRSVAWEAETAYAAMRPQEGYSYGHGLTIVIRSSGRSERSIGYRDYKSLAAESAVPHSHAKLSLLDGTSFMVGALARLTINGARLSEPGKRALDDLELHLPSADPLDNNKAQAVELVHDVSMALDTVNLALERGLEEEERPPVQVREAEGTSVSEAPRGLLIHSYRFDAEGIVTAADIVTPTALNAASIEQRVRLCLGQRAEMELSRLRKHIEMIVRAYDPCISCAVH